VANVMIKADQRAPKTVWPTGRLWKKSAGQCGNYHYRLCSPSGRCPASSPVLSSRVWPKQSGCIGGRLSLSH